jgi:hypothetical protein
MKVLYMERSMADAATLGQIPLAVYYARVGLELSKLVFHGQKMTPPYVSMGPLETCSG